MASPAVPSPADTQLALQNQLRAAPAHFDPRQLPLAPAPAPHIALPALHLQPDFLRQRFAHASTPPPPEIYERPRLDQPLSASAVLLALVQREGGLHVLLTQRASHLRNHSGQIAFAGGRIDPSDAHVVACALREAREAFEREYLHVQIRRFSGNISKTANFVGMERSALHRKLKLLGIAVRKSGDPEEDEE